MKFEAPLIPATLQKRYKRFLADVELTSGEIITVHCPNTGSMKNCWQPGWTVYLQDSNNPKRKYPYTWVLSKTPKGEFIGINTHFANKLVEEALHDGRISEFATFDKLEREVKYGKENSRIDLLLHQGKSTIYIEIKSVTLLQDNGIGYFPDAVSARAQKHLRELTEIAKSPNQKAVLLFCVQHSGINSVRPAEHIDPKYSLLLAEAERAGVSVLAYRCEIDPQEIKLTASLPVIIGS